MQIYFNILLSYNAISYFQCARKNQTLCSIFIQQCCYGHKKYLIVGFNFYATKMSCSSIEYFKFVQLFQHYSLFDLHPELFQHNRCMCKIAHVVQNFALVKTYVKNQSYLCKIRLFLLYCLSPILQLYICYTSFIIFLMECYIAR